MFWQLIPAGHSPSLAQRAVQKVEPSAAKAHMREAQSLLVAQGSPVKAAVPQAPQPGEEPTWQVMPLGQPTAPGMQGEVQVPASQKSEAQSVSCEQSPPMATLPAPPAMHTPVSQPPMAPLLQ